MKTSIANLRNSDRSDVSEELIPARWRGEAEQRLCRQAPAPGSESPEQLQSVGEVRSVTVPKVDTETARLFSPRLSGCKTGEVRGHTPGRSYGTSERRV